MAGDRTTIRRDWKNAFKESSTENFQHAVGTTKKNSKGSLRSFAVTKNNKNVKSALFAKTQRKNYLSNKLGRLTKLNHTSKNLRYRDYGENRSSRRRDS